MGRVAGPFCKTKERGIGKTAKSNLSNLLNNIADTSPLSYLAKKFNNTFSFSEPRFVFSSSQAAENAVDWDGLKVVENGWPRENVLSSIQNAAAEVEKSWEQPGA
jgi:hypothetical protein